MKYFLVLGFGRMGITHLAHINGYFSGEAKFDIYDPSFVFRVASYFSVRKNFNFIRRLPLKGKYDAVFITSPPEAHSQNFNSCFDLSNTFFIEKPLVLTDKDIDNAVDAKKKIYCGYVLRHNPCVRKICELFGDEVEEVKVRVASNLGLNPGEDWRFDLSKRGGCLNELGSHAINLALSFASQPTVSSGGLFVDHVDSGKFSLTMGVRPRLRIEGDWNIDVRKTTYSVSVNSPRGEIHSDFQSVWGNIEGKPISWSPREAALDVGFYLRGVDFALQNERFLTSESTSKDLLDAVYTDKIIQEVMESA